MTRRSFLLSAAAALPVEAGPPEPVIDIHQHTNYSGRSDAELIAHQRTMGVTKTVLLPAGSKFGLAVDAGGNDTVVALARKHPKQFVYFANEVPDLDEAVPVIRRYLKSGAIGIGEQKFAVDIDSTHLDRIARLASEFHVPVLLHFQHDAYNTHFERFYRVLDKYPRVNFIGHAQTWWANIDKGADQSVLYPKTKVRPGGMTDNYLSDYPNCYADMSAGSGLNALLRDEDHARDFLKRHSKKLLYGSDCNDRIGSGAKCSGSQCLAAIRRLAPDAKTIRRILHDNAAKLLKI